MKTKRRRTSPLPLLLTAALLLFIAGMIAGWTGASAYAQPGPAPENLNASRPAPAESEAPLPSPTPIPQADKPSPAPDGTSWELILVNGDHPLPEDFDLPALTELRGGHAIDSRAYPALQAMMDDARAAGLQPLICSSYRTWDDQEALFQREVQNWLDRGYIREEAERQAAVWVARPGTSEHQTGLAVDIVDLSYQVLDEGQEDTPVQQWLMVHCWEYGFILRYPTDRSELTGIGYEPWHYRYVGVEIAQDIRESGLCMEEYLLLREEALADRDAV